MVCFPSSFDMCVHAFSKYFPARLFEFQVAMVCVVCLVVECSNWFLVSLLHVPFVLVSSSVVSFVSSLLELFSGGLPGGLPLSVFGSFGLGCFFP